MKDFKGFYMKKALKLLLMYFLFIIAGVFLVSVIYSFFQNVLGFVAGKKLAIFEWKNFMLSVIFITQCIIFLICPLMSYYKIRHSGGVSVLITYIILCLFTWGLFFPIMLSLNKKVVPALKQELVEQPLSGGYFRKVENKIYYFTEDLPSQVPENLQKEMEEEINQKSVNMIVIDTSENGKIQEMRGGKNSRLYKYGQPFRDVLIKDNFVLNERKSVINFRFLISRAQTELEKGISHWLGFLSIGFLISSIYALVSIFAWRLVNTIICFFATFCAVVLNTFYFSQYMESFRALSFMHNPFFEFLSRYVDEPFLCLVNVIFGLIFISAGIIKFFVSKSRQVE